VRQLEELNLISIKRMTKKISLNDFLYHVERGKFSELEIHNYIDAATDNFNVEKLGPLLNDIDYYIFQRKEDFWVDNADKLNSIIEQYVNEGKDIPFKEVPDLNTFISKEKGCSQTIKVLDRDKLLSNAIHYQLFSIYELKGLINCKLQKYEVVKNIQTNSEKEELSEYLTEDGKAVLPVLLKIYTGVKKKEYALLYLALQELELFSERITLLGEGRVITLLTNTFGPQVGGRGNFNKYLNEYRHPDSVMRTEIEYHKQRIFNYLNKSK
jgi:hypothetical protein